MLQACVLANGEYRHEDRLLAVAQQAHLLVAADGGANWLAKQGLAPHVLVGDMDSISEQVRCWAERRGTELVTVNPQKDETDLELAILEAAARGARSIVVLGALGGRIDHALANIHLLALPQLRDRDVRLYDGATYLWLVRQRTEIHGQPGDLVSLMPFASHAHGLHTSGLQYALNGETLLFGPARGISNVMTEARATVEVGIGAVLVAHTPRLVEE